VGKSCLVVEFLFFTGMPSRHAQSVRNRKEAMDEKLQKELTRAVSEIEKKFGTGAIVRLGRDRPLEEVNAVTSTGVLSLDLALGIGGIPKGKVIEIFGPESSGKTTLTLQMLAEAQRAGNVVAFVDAEHSLDPTYAKALGVKVEDLLVSQPDSGEQALQIVSMLVESNSVGLIVIDSVAALTPRAEIEGEMGDSHVGLHARLMSQALRKLTGSLARSQCTVVFINQLRMKIGVMFGNPETTTGGNALKFYASQRLDIRRIGQVKQGDEAIGNRVKVKVVKNKCAAPFREAEFDILFGKGASKSGDLLDLAVAKGLVEKNGSWFAYHGERLGQGRENTRDLLEKDASLMRRIEEEVLIAVGLRKLAPTTAKEAPKKSKSA
jgi:recombination protein RecA